MPLLQAPDKSVQDSGRRLAPRRLTQAARVYRRRWWPDLSLQPAVKPRARGNPVHRADISRDQQQDDEQGRPRRLNLVRGAGILRRQANGSCGGGVGDVGFLEVAADERGLALAATEV
jgi:hypothetical protein